MDISVVENFVFLWVQGQWLTLLTSSSMLLLVFAPGHWTGLKAVFCCSHGVNLCHIKEHAAAARSSSSTWGAAFCFSVCCMCERMSDGALPSPEFRLQISRSHVLQWPLATFYSRPGLKGAPQLLMHPTHLVLRTLRLSSSFRNLENTSVIWWTETTVSNKVWALAIETGLPSQAALLLSLKLPTIYLFVYYCVCLLYSWVHDLRQGLPLAWNS